MDELDYFRAKTLAGQAEAEAAFHQGDPGPGWRCGRHDGGGATTRRQNSDLADYIARPDDPDLCPVDRDLGGAVFDHEERMAEVALAYQCVTGRELALGRDGCKGTLRR
jgi:hypothetical protein